MSSRISIPGGWEFDPTTDFIYYNGEVQSGSIYEPIFLSTPSQPVFTGIYNKMEDTIILMSGKIVKNTNSEFIVL